MFGTTAPSPPTAATGQLRVGGDSGQGEGYSGAEGPFCVQPDDRRGGRGCRPGEGKNSGSHIGSVKNWFSKCPTSAGTCFCEDHK